MGFLFKTPDGFLDLTGQRVGGKYPNQVSDVAAPIVDITNLLAGRKIATETAPSLTSALGDQADITVPDNQTWILLFVSTVFGPGANNSERVDIDVRLTNLPGSSDPTNYVSLMEHLGTTGVQALRLELASQPLPVPIALPAGAIIRGEIVDFSVNNLPWAVKAGFYRLEGN